jgi:glutamine---fructose-6-phosphate transaminase (isomerizing)
MSMPEGAIAHRILQDIMSEPEVLADTIAEGAARLPGLAGQIREWKIDAVHPIGCGSSYIAGIAGRYAFEEWTGLPALPLSAKDFEFYALRGVRSSALVIAISQSGETRETVDAALASKKRGVRVVALTNNEASSLARICDGIVCTKAGQEEGPGTKTVLAQCVGIYQLVLYLAREFGAAEAVAVAEAVTELGVTSHLVDSMLSGSTRERVEELACLLAGETSLYLLGAGPFSALALQVANLLREVGKLHCYAFEATEFRHGPLEALSKESRLLVLSHSRCRAQDQVAKACQAAKKAGVGLLYVGDARGRPDVEFDTELILPTASELLAAQIYLAPLQLLGFHIAKRRGLDPDHLTNIVKTWTT